MKSLRFSSLVMSLFVVGAIVLPASSAFAATGNVESTSTWRNISSQELADFNPFHESATDLLGNQTSSDSNFENASNSSPGWLPDGSTLAQPNSSQYQSIILDLPKVDLGCSSDVQIEITNGNAELLDSSTGSSAGLGWMIVNDFNRPLFMDNGTVSHEIETNSVPGSYSLAGSESINPQSTAFGLKLVIGLQTWQSSNTNQWDVHDLAVRYTYDDEGGSCTPTPAPVATSCSDDYFASTGTVLNEVDLSSVRTQFGSLEIENVDGDPQLIKSAGGLNLNAGLDDSTSFRIMELSISPQSILLTAGTVQLLVDYDFVPTTYGTVLFTILGNLDTAYPWQSVDAAFQSGVATTYLPSSELEQVHIYFLIQTSAEDDQLSSNLSNVSVKVRHLKDVAVCGINLTNSQLPDGGSTPGNIPGSGTLAGGVSSLPATGKSTLPILFAAFSFLISGQLLLRLSKFRIHKFS